MSRTLPLFARLRVALAPRLAPVLIALLLLPAAGCLSTKVRVHANAGESGGGVLVRVCTDARAARQGRADAPATLVELFRLEPGGREVFLQRSLAHEWGVAELPPGRYRLRVEATVDEAGHVREVRTGDREADFTVADGETAEATIILKKAPTGLIVAVGVTVVVLVVALAVILSQSDLPSLPSPAEVLHGAARTFPPAPPVGHLVVAAEIGAVPVPTGGPGWEEELPPPRVTSTAPEHGAVVGARRVTPTLTLSQPLDESALRPDTIVMLGSRSGLVRGRTVLRGGLLRFEPEGDLSPGEDVTVTVRAAGVVNAGGRQLAEDFSWGFRIAP